MPRAGLASTRARTSPLREPGSASGAVVLDRTPILPPRWASGGVPGRDRARLQQQRRASRARRLLVAAAAVGVAVLSLRAALVPQEAFGAARPGPVHVQRPVDRPIGLRIVDLPDPCPLDWRADHAQVGGLIACEAALWDVPGGADRAMSAAQCESRFQPAAFNPTGCGGSGCGGLFQQSLRYWRGRAAEYGYRGSPPSDPRANVVVSMRMAVERGTWSQDWPVCGR